MNSTVRQLGLRHLILSTLGYVGILSMPAVSAENDNFRLALPDDYDVKTYEANDHIDGGIVNFVSQTTTESNGRTLRLQSYLAQYLTTELKEQAHSDPATFARRVLATRLEKDCVNFKVNLGRVRLYNSGKHINWWSECKRLNTNESYEFERGRYYSNDSGIYIYSHYETGKGKDFKFSVKDVKWFDRYLNSSALCKSGEDCGLEGTLVDKIFVE